LTKKERDRLAYVAFQRKDAHEDFLALLYPDGIPQRKKRRSRLSKEHIMRAADRQNRRKAA
jgi:hypothetical protein